MASPASVRLARYMTPGQITNVRAAESLGHELLSRGCSSWRCAKCDATGYIDSSETDGKFMEQCPGK